MKKPFGLFAAGCLAGIIALTALLASGCDIFSGNSDNSLNPGGGSNPGTDSNPTLPSNPNPNPTPPSTPPPQKPNSGEEITALSIGGIQGTRTTGNRTVTVTLPAGTTVTELKNLAPVITYSGTGISPASGVSQNFYKNGFTPVLYTVTAANGSTAVWTVIVRLEPLDTGAGIGTVIGDYISAASTGADPVPLPVNIDLASGWSTLLSAIQAGGKYVALDLSACTMSGTTFDPGTANTGESRIVSLILPDAARSIKAGDYGNLVFKHFTVLASLTGATVTDIGDCAFWDCDFLTTVSLPAATAINYRAFYNCDALTTITLPAALSIDYSVFADCVALTSISLPVATTIRSFAFADCVALTTVSLPAATGI
ncbi:MAG: leucine-rich repeat domain-containing protein, partial [Treponema sp.]|nr:leucine-rich repeat domain-containing protein [Treponema sp.]